MNHCHYNLGMARERHNAILERILCAVQEFMGTKLKEWPLPSTTGDNRPDLTIISPDETKITIVEMSRVPQTPSKMLCKHQGRQVPGPQGIPTKGLPIDSRGEGLETETINTNQCVHSVKFGAQAIHDKMTVSTGM